MEQTIQQTTEYYLSILPEDKEFYYLQDFEFAGVPSFLVGRIQFILSLKLAQSVNRPETKWADTSDQVVNDSWQQFVESLHTKGRVPAEHLEPVLKKAVTDIIHTLLRPGGEISKILFEEKSTLTVDELNDRIDRLVVYSYLGRVLTRYMQRKGKNELSRKKCDEIIVRAGQKITRDYSAEQWAETLRPLFELIHFPVKADLFRLFFEGQGMQKEAQIFANLDSRLTRDEFIRVLSNDQKRQNNQSDGSGNKTGETGNGSFKKRKTADYEPHSSRNYKESEAQRSTSIEEQAVDAVQALFAESNDDQTEVEDKDQDNEPPKELEKQANKFKGGSISGQIESDAQDRDQDTEQNEPPVSLNDIFGDNSERDNGWQREKESSATQAGSYLEQEDDDKTPIWQLYTNSEGKDDDRLVESDEHEVNGRRRDLKEYLQGDEEYFANALFQGSLENYYQALENISELPSWNEAYRLIGERIFKPNDINIYSEAAVDFTDQLQDYFDMKGKKA